MSTRADAGSKAASWQDQVYDLLRQHNVTQFSYVPDAGHKIRSEVLASNANGPAFAYAPSAPTTVVFPKPVMSKLPKVSGIARVGNSLAVSNGNWKYLSTGYAYQWLRCNSLGMSCKKILDATNSTYLLLSTDVGHRFQAKVTATNAAGSATTTSANKSALVKP